MGASMIVVARMVVMKSLRFGANRVMAATGESGRGGLN
jgi:hypothetical protein